MGFVGFAVGQAAFFGAVSMNDVEFMNGSVQKDIYYARARGYASALSSALFHDNVPPAVYDNLITAVRRQLPAVHRYYDLRRRKMRLRHIHHYDTYVPILSELKSRHTWKQAVDVIIESLQPLASSLSSLLGRPSKPRVLTSVLEDLADEYVDESQTELNKNEGAVSLTESDRASRFATTIMDRVRDET